MSELISGKEAKLAWANGVCIELCYKQYKEENAWFKLLSSDELSTFDRDDLLFRIKPKTITINGIEVPAPFLPDEDELFYHASPEYEKGYAKSMAHERNETTWQQFGAWRTEEEIKQVVSALRTIFKGEP